MAYSPPVNDLAVLVLAEPVPAGVEAAPLRFPRPADLAGRSWWAFGFPDRDPDSMSKTLSCQLGARIEREQGIKLKKNDDGYWAE